MNTKNQTKYIIPKRAAVINDLSGVGRCSLTVSLPILSVMGVQCCPLPTAILSNQTEYPSYYLTDFTPHMNAYLEEWKKLSFSFDAFASGFLGSMEQIDIVLSYIESTDCQFVFVDPVMGDHGNLYPSYTKDMCREMKKLCKKATIITPNLTEACILTDTEYTPDTFTSRDYLMLCEKLSKLGPKYVVITGIEKGDKICNYTYECFEDGSYTTHFHKYKRIHPSRPGTGDVFSSVLLGSMMNGLTFDAGVAKASRFVKTCLRDTAKLDIPINDGVCFEKFLKTL